MKATSLLFPAALLVLLSACKKEDNEPALPTIVTLQITGPDEQPVANVPVALYASQADWATEQNPVQAATTTANGEARFLYLEKSEYYVNAAAGTLSNWESGYRINGILQGQASQAIIPVREYRSHKIARANGKVWTLAQYRVNGTDLTNDPTSQCLTDNRWIFYKGAGSGRFQLDEGEATCHPDDPQLTTGTWQILDNGTTLELPENGAVSSFTLEHVSATTLRFTRTIGADTYSYVLQSN